MVIEMAGRSMQSPKGIVENVLVKINKCIFLVNFIILDIIEDDKVPIIPRRPMLATAHARIDVFGKKISLEVGTEQITFDINDKNPHLLLSDEDLGSFPNDNDLLHNLEIQDTMDLTNEATNSPVKPEFLSSGNRIHLYSPYNLKITCKIGFVNFDPYIEPPSPFNIMSRKAYNSIIKHELVYTWNNMVGFARNLHVFVGGHQFLTDFIILENINEFVEKGLTEVLFGQPFKEHVGLVEDLVKGVLWFKIGDDKTIFNMPRAEERFGKLTVRQHNTMGPLLKISDEDKSKGIHHPYQKIKGFYQGYLELGKEYKHDQEVPAAMRQLSRPTRPVILWLSHPSQHYGVTWTLDYTVTSFKLARWKVRVSSLQRKPLKGYSVTYSKSINRGLIQTIEDHPFYNHSTTALRSDPGFYTSKNSTRSPREITLNLLLYLLVHKPHLLWFYWISFDYHVTLGFGSIAGGLDHVKDAHNGAHGEGNAWIKLVEYEHVVMNLTCLRPPAATVGNTCKLSINTACDQAEFGRISLKGFRSYTSRSHYRSVSKQTTRTLKIYLVFTMCERQVHWNSVLMRFMDDLLALDSIVRFGFSNRRLELTATFSIPTNSE
ncbi:hypothetical protein Tco_0407417 [Tanacetum coccineum]